MKRKFNITAIFKSKELIRDGFLRRFNKNVELDLDILFDEDVESYFVTPNKKLYTELRNHFNLHSTKIHFNLPTNNLGDTNRDLNFVVEIITPNNVIRQLKINKALGIDLPLH